MKTRVYLKYVSRISTALLFTAIVLSSGCSNDNNNSKADNKQTQTAQKQDSKDMYLVRDKSVNIDSLDQDKDGNLYQCQMDYDVISDKPGTCPKCGMQLEKVSVDIAKKNFESFINN